MSPPSLAAGIIGDQTFGLGNRKLVGDIALGRSRSRPFQKYAEHAHRAKLDSYAQAIVIATMRGDEYMIGIVEVEIAG